MAEIVGGIATSVTMDDSTLDAGLSRLRSAIDSTKVQIGMLTAGLANGSVSASDYASHLAKLEGELKRLQATEANLMAAHQGQATAAKAASDALNREAEAAEKAAKAVKDATDAERARVAAIEANLIPINSLIMAGLKYKDTLESIAQAELAANNSAGQMSAAGARFAASGAAMRGGGAVEGAAQVLKKGGGTTGADGTKVVAMNLADVAVKSNIARQRLMAFGNTLDDLQYVGEMGLRPIINNVMQISPAVGIALLAFDQLRKHGDALKPVAIAVGEHWLGAFDKATGGALAFINAVKAGEAVVRGMGKWIEEFGEGWDALTQKRKREQEASIKAFEEEATTDQKAKGKSVTKAIEAYGQAKFLDDAIKKESESDALLRSGDKEAVREAKARLVDLQAKADKGDPNAVAAILRRTQGTGVGRAIRSGMAGPVTEAEKAADRKLNEEFEERIRNDEEALEKAVGTSTDALQGRYNRLVAGGAKVTQTGLAAEIRRTGLPQAQGMLDPLQSRLQANYTEMIGKRMADKGITRQQAEKEFLENEAEKDKAEAERKAKPAKKAEEEREKKLNRQLDAAEAINDIRERDYDLRYSLRQKLTESGQGKSMGLDEYEASIKSGGENKLEKRMHEVAEILKKIKDNAEKVTVIARKAR